MALMSRDLSSIAAERDPASGLNSESGVFPEQIKTLELYQPLPPLIHHYAGIHEADAEARLKRDINYRALWQEKLAGHWFAALVTDAEPEPDRIQVRFETWGELVDFLSERDALVEVWVSPESGRGNPRRLTALELAGLKQQRFEPPTCITVTYPEASTGKVVCYRVEFGFQAAAMVQGQQRAYLQHRQIQLSAQEILGARDEEGRIDSRAQWEGLRLAVQEGRFPMRELPLRPLNPRGLFVAFEFEVDEQNQIQQAIRAYRDREVYKQIVGNAALLLADRGREKGA